MRILKLNESIQRDSNGNIIPVDISIEEIRRVVKAAATTYFNTDIHKYEVLKEIIVDIFGVSESDIANTYAHAIVISPRRGGGRWDPEYEPAEIGYTYTGIWDDYVDGMFHDGDFLAVYAFRVCYQKLSKDDQFTGDVAEMFNIMNADTESLENWNSGYKWIKEELGWYFTEDSIKDLINEIVANFKIDKKLIDEFIRWGIEDQDWEIDLPDNYY